jgi:hypothetical protein
LGSPVPRTHTPGVWPLDAPISTQRQGPFLYGCRQGSDAMLVLMMVFEITVALALGFVVGRIYQIRRYELERGFTLPPTARIPQP